MSLLTACRKNLAYMIFLAVFFIAGCGQSAAPPKPAAELTLHDAAVRMAASMTLEEKLGQMLVIGIEGQQLDPGAKAMLRDNHAGGVILFDRNMHSQDQVRQLNRALQDYNGIYNRLPLYLCVDQEGGQVVRMRHDLTAAPAASVLAQNGDADAVGAWAYQTATELKELGFNVNFAPVLDIDIPNERSYGRDAATVTRFTQAACAGYDKSGIIYSLKHFPGMGKSAVDPHTEQYRITAAETELLNEDIAPFRNIIGKFPNQNFMVMVGHLIYTELDTLPASVSPQIIQKLLRQQLGFKGLVVTDDMEMGALTGMYDFSEMGVAAVRGGADLLLVCHNYEHQRQVYNGILTAVKEGRLAESVIDTAAVRIIENKLLKLLSSAQRQIFTEILPASRQ